MHPNTKEVMKWADAMSAKHGPADHGNDWCRALAYYCDEAGNDHPSDYAMHVAKEWLETPPKRCCSCGKILLNQSLDACVACSS